MITEEKQNKVFTRNFYRKVGKAIHDYELIADGDRILVGVSGGKDSLALLEVLAMRAKDPKQHYTVVAAHIAVEDVSYEVDSDYLRLFCERLGVEYVYRMIRVDTTVNPKKPACFICSWHRRKMLFDIAKEYDCKKLALGHHRDDAVESLVMSMIFNGTICSMPARLEMFDNTFTLIRPLIYLSNDETARYAEMRQFNKQVKHCPHEKSTNRDAVSRLVDQMTLLSPHARSNLFAAMQNIREDYLP